MLLSTQTGYLFYRYDVPRAISVMAEAGYEAIDYSMFDMESDNSPLNHCDLEKHAEMLVRCAKENGLRFNQAHAPFPCWRAGDDAYNAKMPERIERAVKLAGMIGASCIVVHPIACSGGEEKQKEVNMALYRKLEPIALEYNVRVALENMWGFDAKRHCIVPNVCSFGRDLADYYDTLNNPRAFTVCLDLGHCGLVGEEAEDAIRALGRDRLGALHVHDNNYREDTHTLPYTFGCSMNWDNITKALGEIDYAGDFTYEADNFLSHFDESLLPDAVRFMAKVGRCLMGKIEENRHS